MSVLTSMSEHALLTLPLSLGAATGRVPRDICYSRTGELLLWGPALWDPRAPRRIHRFDIFAENCGGSIFHPAGLEAILNSEVGPWSVLCTCAACLPVLCFTLHDSPWQGQRTAKQNSMVLHSPLARLPILRLLPPRLVLQTDWLVIQTLYTF